MYWIDYKDCDSKEFCHKKLNQCKCTNNTGDEARKRFTKSTCITKTDSNTSSEIRMYVVEPNVGSRSRGNNMYVLFLVFSIYLTNSSRTYLVFDGPTKQRMNLSSKMNDQQNPLVLLAIRHTIAMILFILEAQLILSEFRKSNWNKIQSIYIIPLLKIIPFIK